MCDLTNKQNYGQEVVINVNKKHTRMLNSSRLMLNEKYIKSMKFKLFRGLRYQKIIKTINQL